MKSILQWSAIQSKFKISNLLPYLGSCQFYYSGSISLMVAYFLIGCMTPEKEMTPWIMRSSSELIGQWGPPNHKEFINNGCEIWIYQKQQKHTTPGYSNTYGQSTSQMYGDINYDQYGYANYRGNSTSQSYSNITYTPSQSYVKTHNRSFYINSNGVIYNVKWGSD